VMGVQDDRCTLRAILKQAGIEPDVFLQQK
jgi:hypothetical protein